MQKKIACINDISGIGKCSLTVALPIISALKCQCCPLPTSVLSSQTGYPEYTFVDLTDSMKKYIETWNSLGKNFDTIYSGFLGSLEQIKSVEYLIKINPSSFVIVDPILGDLGEIFPIFSQEDVEEMKKLVRMANMITPNLTEANLLLGKKADEKYTSDDSLYEICKELSKLGPETVIITGYIEEDTIYNVCYNATNEEFFKVGNFYNKQSFSGTGDIFTSIVSGLITRGFELNKAVTVATDFIKKAVEYTSGLDSFDRNDGIMFELFLSDLTSI
ncbi:pyridoxamine kinase [Peptostreptococcus anaerobius]|uniref:pyridoxal kinase n=1 Tax=Peptostreptococcus porci TaxID=2652282 RepID=A0A6N7XC75_9FIRM|nr:pyridoxamine kinase [Peptostreptococcus porci]MDY4560868.1 pyridoxamine kinase [Peptostreptococcus porci]MDY6230794.1 pyridoxamine kinase [Peptostreptococcus porci]MST61902.1 pyridoxamine kinase [Peptostreptococcus porci]